MSDLISRREAIDVAKQHWYKPDIAKALEELPSVQPDRLTDDDFETIRIHLNAHKEALCNQHRWEEAEEYQRIIDRFMAFASAQPETNCSEILNNSDTISRQAAIDAINTWDKFGVDERSRIVRWHEGLEPYVHLRDVLTAIVNLPPAQPTIKPRAKGKWDFIGDNMFMCTSCGAIYTVQQLECLKQHVTDLYIPPYCPNCGADMREVTE